MQTTTIEWTDATWNPVRGCEKISPGCEHCYAEAFAERWRGIPGHPYEQGFNLRLVPDKLLEPLGWAKPRSVFVNSMSDLFQRGVPQSYVESVFRVMQGADWHTYQVLTKRAARMRRAVERLDVSIRTAPHVWLGVSVDDRKHGLPRIEQLRQTAAEVRFLSIEPLLEDLGELDLTGIDWVIVGGESGAGARPMAVEWVRAIRDQCEAANVRFFFKQWGGLRKKVAGRLLDGRLHDDMPPHRRAAVPNLQRRRLIFRMLHDQVHPATVAELPNPAPARCVAETIGREAG